MDKKIKVLMVVLFSILLVSANFSLFSAEKDCTKCDGCGDKVAKVKDTAVECTCETVYKCPMEACDFTSEKDGKCLKCGMALKKVEAKPVYKCTTDGCKFTSHKEGSCPQCKTELKKIECLKHKAHGDKGKAKKI